MFHRSMMIRGGHGWVRPAVPLQVPYVNKRKIDIFDTNLWFYCNVMPEYFINQNEMYLQSVGGSVKQFFIDGRFVAAAVLGVFLIREFLFEKRVAGIAPDAFNKTSHTYTKQVLNTRPWMKRHFLDLNMNGDSGLYPMGTGEKTFAVDYLQKYEENKKSLYAMNQEAKAFVERVEKESREKVFQKHGLMESHEHHHH